ncbi:hypothetical protein A2U01_0048517, partial [Trifolium medium]|nr:hypothetical protein [Trifolium medium]
GRQIPPKRQEAITQLMLTIIEEVNKEKETPFGDVFINY